MHAFRTGVLILTTSILGQKITGMVALIIDQLIPDQIQCQVGDILDILSIIILTAPPIVVGFCRFCVGEGLPCPFKNNRVAA